MPIEGRRGIGPEDRVDRFKLNTFTQPMSFFTQRYQTMRRPFQILFDVDLKARFYKDRNDIISSTDFIVIGSGVHKGQLIKKYGKAANDPYTLSFSFVIEA